MTSALLCLGGNTEDTAGNISQATDMLAQCGRIHASSGQYPSASGYLNEVVSFETELSAEALVAYAKQMEVKLGRQPQMKALGIVPIDIDLVVYAGCVLRPQDYNSAYFHTGLQKIAQKKLAHHMDDFSKFFTNFPSLTV